MQDNESGSEQQGSWQPPEYVSPWIPGSNAGGADADDAPGSGDTISFGSPEDYGQPRPSQPGYQQPWFGQPRHQQAGYGQQEYGQQEYGQPGYGQPAQGGYGAWGGSPGGQHPWGGYGTPPPPQGSRFGRFLAYVAVAALAAGIGAGAAIALDHSASTSSAQAPQSNTNPGGGGGQQNPFGGGNGGGGNGGGGVPGNQNGGGGGINGGSGPLDPQTIANKVDPGVVDITSELKYNNATAEGTGMVISTDGLVLTNNHVINQATSVTATLVVSGKTYSARVVGYDSIDDVALLQLQGAVGLKTVNLGDSTKVKVGQAVLALGNAGGRGGLPSTAQGTVNGLNRTIQASDNGDGSQPETLHGMLETDAPIQEGDSGGPLVDSAGRVIGMDTAANTASGFGQDQTSGTIGFAIPIDHAVSIAGQIANGHASATVHIGLSGFIGINVADASAGCSGFGGVTSPVNSGALVCTVYPGTPADAAGLTNGDVITSINGQSVGTSNDLTKLMAGDHPGDQLNIVFVDPAGTSHTTTVTLSAMAK